MLSIVTSSLLLVKTRARLKTISGLIWPVMISPDLHFGDVLAFRWCHDWQHSSHPVGPIPVSMFHEDGTMRKFCKSDLVQQFEKEVSPVLSLPDFDPSLTTYIRDGMALVQCYINFFQSGIFLPSMTWNTFVWAVTLVRRSLSADLMEFFPSI
jgi:hypothetical protein